MRCPFSLSRASNHVQSNNRIIQLNFPGDSPKCACMKKEIYLLGCVVQAVLTYKKRYRDDAPQPAGRLTDRHQYHELPIFIQQHYELLLCWAIGRYAASYDPDRILWIMNETLQNSAWEDESWEGTPDAIIRQLQNRISEALN